MKQIDQGVIARNGRGSPIIGGKTYPRVTTLIGRGEDKSGLMNYMMQTGIEGVYDSPDLQAAYAVLDLSDRKAKTAFFDKVKARARSDAKATIGTAVHEVTERLDRGEDISGLPKVLTDDAHAYRATVLRLGLVPLAAELFVVNQDIGNGAAGTLDRLFSTPSGDTIIGDLKTSGNANSVKYSLSSWAAQCAVYARGKPVLDGKIVEWEELGLPAPSLTSGVVVHVVQGKAISKGYSVNLEDGWNRAKAAAWLYLDDASWRKADRTAY
jgi:hypothetical protein